MIAFAPSMRGILNTINCPAPLAVHRRRGLPKWSGAPSKTSFGARNPQTRTDSPTESFGLSTSYSISGISAVMAVATSYSQSQSILGTRDAGIPTVCPMLSLMGPSVSPTRKSVRITGSPRPRRLLGQSCGEEFNIESLNSSP